MADFQARCGVPVIFPGFHNARIPQDVVYFFDDFLSCSWSVIANGTDEAMKWKSTVVAQAATGLTILSATDGAEDEAGGVLSIETEATADDGENLQVHGESFHLDGGYPLYFECRLLVKDVSNLDFFVGISQTDAEIITGGVANRVGFELSGGTLSFVSEDGSSQKTTDTAIVEADDDWIRVAFFWDGLKLIASVDTDDNGTYRHVATHVAAVVADYVPQAIMMTPTIEAIVGSTATTEIMYVDYIQVVQQRFSE